MSNAMRVSSSGGDEGGDLPVVRRPEYRCACVSCDDARRDASGRNEFKLAFSRLYGMLEIPRDRKGGTEVIALPWQSQRAHWLTQVMGEKYASVAENDCGGVAGIVNNRIREAHLALASLRFRIEAALRSVTREPLCERLPRLYTILERARSWETLLIEGAMFTRELSAELDFVQDVLGHRPVGCVDPIVFSERPAALRVRSWTPRVASVLFLCVGIICALLTLHHCTSNALAPGGAVSNWVAAALPGDSAQERGAGMHGASNPSIDSAGNRGQAPTEPCGSAFDPSRTDLERSSSAGRDSRVLADGGWICRQWIRDVSGEPGLPPNGRVSVTRFDPLGSGSGSSSLKLGAYLPISDTVMRMRGVIRLQSAPTSASADGTGTEPRAQRGPVEDSLSPERWSVLGNGHLLAKPIVGRSTLNPDTGAVDVPFEAVFRTLDHAPLVLELVGPERGGGAVSAALGWVEVEVSEECAR